MTELFLENGHLTDHALLALIREEELDELARLEVAEHLSFCDSCTARYALLLEENLLRSPPVPLYGAVMKRVKSKERWAFVKKLATVSAAACLTLVFWWSGLFSYPAKGDGRQQWASRMDAMQLAIKEERNAGRKEVREELERSSNAMASWTENQLAKPEQILDKIRPKENLHGEK